MIGLKAKELAFITGVLVVLGAFAVKGSDPGLMLTLFLGFIYASALAFSLKNPPKLTRCVFGVFILGTVNFFLLFTAAPIALIDDYLPEFMVRFLLFLVPGLFGGAVTYFVMSRYWNLEFPHNSLLTLMLWIAAATLCSVAIMYNLPYGYNSGFMVVNGLLWCLAFTLCLLRLDSQSKRQESITSHQ